MSVSSRSGSIIHNIEELPATEMVFGEAALASRAEVVASSSKCS
ncbi:MAG TPA: hypothetical protein VGP24_15685 [Glaciihabitans sp.]|jgi:hypothetical protein|nr:hypothetical protein [Glaciihabitans sp.]